MTNSCGFRILFDFYLFLYIYDDTKKERGKLALNRLGCDIMEEERKKNGNQICMEQGHARKATVVILS